MPGSPIDMRVSLSNNSQGPFSAAPKEVVVIPKLIADFSTSRAAGHVTNIISGHFDQFTCSGSGLNLPSLQVVQPDCGFFTAEVFDPISNNSILASEHFPTEARICGSFSVFSFLRMSEGSGNTSSLPAGGWPDPTAAQRFVSAIQWFITDIFGYRVGSSSFMFKCLQYLRGRLASSALLQAWPSMDHRTFLVIIMATVHDLWITLLQWEEACTMVPLYYKSD